MTLLVYRGWVNRCSTVSCYNLRIMLNIKMDLRMCITQTKVISLALFPEQHTPQVMSPTSFVLKVMQTLYPLRTVTKIKWELKILMSDKLHLLKCLKNRVFRQLGETLGHFNERLHGEECTDKFRYCNKDILTMFKKRGQSSNLL